MMSIPSNYVRVMYARFADGSVIYHRPYEFKLLESAWDELTDYYSVYVPEDGIELR